MWGGQKWVRELCGGSEGSQGTSGSSGGSQGSQGGSGIPRGSPSPPVAPSPTQQEEGVVLVARRVLLRLEQCVEIPEGALHKIIRGHLREPERGATSPLGDEEKTPVSPPPLLEEPPDSPHLQEDLAQLRAHLEQRVQVAAGRGQPQGGEVVGFEGQTAPGASGKGVRGRDGAVQGSLGGSGGHVRGDHLRGQLRLRPRHGRAEGAALADPVGLEGPGGAEKGLGDTQISSLAPR